MVGGKTAVVYLTSFTERRILTAQDGGTDIAVTYSAIINERRLPMAQE
jgi:hypothetical protein